MPEVEFFCRCRGWGYLHELQQALFQWHGVRQPCPCIFETCGQIPQNLTAVPLLTKKTRSYGLVLRWLSERSIGAGPKLLTGGVKGAGEKVPVGIRGCLVVAVGTGVAQAEEGVAAPNLRRAFNVCIWESARRLDSLP
jgi:hypothetical protein